MEPNRRERHCAKRKADFLEAFARLGRVDLATKIAGVCRTAPYEWANRNPKFDAAWERARKKAMVVMEDEAHRRAVEGYDKPVYQGGKMVGEVREYSDTLLMFLMKANNSAKYRETIRNENTGPNGGPQQVTIKVEYV